MSEITTIEDLKNKILSAPMIPKPICRTLWYTFGWKSYISDHLTSPALENHSKFNSFLISREDGEAKLRAKKLPQDSQLVPRAGIRLLKEGHDLEAVGASEFRIEKINFDKIMKGIKIYLSQMPLETQMRVQTSWDNLRETLEGLPKKSPNLEKMRLADLPRLTEEEAPPVPGHLIVNNEAPQLIGDHFPEEVDHGHLEDEIAPGIDVCIYTDERRSRPWVGRIVKILENKEFVLQWYSRKSGRGSVFTALTKDDGSPSLVTLANETVMFWMMAEPQSRSEHSFSLSPYWLETIRREYEEIDSSK